MPRLAHLSLFSLIVATPAMALVPPDYQEPPSDFKAEVETGFQLNTGNTESTSFNGRTKLVYDTSNARQEGTLKAYFASDSEKTTAEKYDLQLQSNYKLNGSYIYGRGDFTWDQFGSYTEIFTVSSGYGFDAIKDSDTRLSLEVGPGYRYNLPQEESEQTSAIAEKDLILRLAAKFEQRIHEYTSLTADVTSEVGENNNTLSLDMAYKNTIFLNWAFKVGFNIKYTEVVPLGSKQTDTVSTFNLLYTFQ
ncbi:DUF481 domain-containing protein [Shewanella sp. GXUN23E]|uniref:DUF481 domain-containing protein n=1 Tax=Shewanella sp. GXUN23E TaxID=3422498 RepID=UPI003D7DC0BF